MFPWRGKDQSPYDILIAETLLKRTTSTAAARVYAAFLRQFPDVVAINDAPVLELAEALRTVGLHKQRARGMKQMAAYLVERRGGGVPRSLKGLRAIPHVGPYAASAVMSFALNRRVAVVDSNVERIVRRLFANQMPAQPRTKDVQEIADLLLPRRAHRDFNFALLDLGALVCRYDRPRCEDCPLRNLCDTAASC